MFRPDDTVLPQRSPNRWRQWSNTSCFKKARQPRWTSVPPAPELKCFFFLKPKLTNVQMSYFTLVKLRKGKRFRNRKRLWNGRMKAAFKLLLARYQRRRHRLILALGPTTIERDSRKKFHLPALLFFFFFQTHKKTQGANYSLSNRLAVRLLPSLSPSSDCCCCCSSSSKSERGRKLLNV